MPFLWFGCLPWARVFKSWSQPVVSLGAEEPLSGEVYGEEVRSLGAGPQRGLWDFSPFSCSFYPLLLLCTPAMLFCLAISPHHTHTGKSTNSHAVSTPFSCPQVQIDTTPVALGRPPAYTMAGTEEQIAHYNSTH